MAVERFPIEVTFIRSNSFLGDWSRFKFVEDDTYPEIGSHRLVGNSAMS